jgi:hypothetical protein
VRKPIIILLLFMAGSVGVVLVFRLIDINEAIAQIARIGYLGSAVFVLNLAVTFLAPAVGWHLLMRADGIPVTLRQSLVSGLMGHAFNLITPMMYMGGEPIRVFHIASVTGVSKRQVLATIIVNKVQEIAGLALLLVVGAGVAIFTADLSGPYVAAAALAGIILLAFLVAVVGLFVGNFKPTVKLLLLIARMGIFPRQMMKLRHTAKEMEAMVREHLTQRWRVFVLSQLITLLSPLAQLLRPTLFFAFLAASGADVRLPGIPELAVFFVLSQIVFMLPSTPGGLGVYEGGLVVIFTQVMHWSAADGGAYAILVRTADLLLISVGVWLVVHYGMTSLLKSVMGSKGAPALSIESQTYYPGNPPPPGNAAPPA